MSNIQLLQKLPLEEKVEHSLYMIAEWYNAFDGAVYVSFSGGLDSTVLLYLVRSLYPEVEAVFCNTGLEHPENLKFIRQFDNVRTIRPIIKFKEVLEKEGYPIISKKVAGYIREYRNSTLNMKLLRNKGIDKKGKYIGIAKIPEKWKFLVHSPFKISEKCCDFLKKKPFILFEKNSGKMPFLGVMAVDSFTRQQSFTAHGCNKFDMKRPYSAPLSIWKREDSLKFIRLHKISISKAYTPGVTHTGCMFCLFGIAEEYTKTGTNRFLIMETLYPKYYKYCMETLKIKEVLEYLRIPYSNSQITKGIFKI